MTLATTYRVSRDCGQRSLGSMSRGNGNGYHQRRRGTLARRARAVRVARDEREEATEEDEQRVCVAEGSAQQVVVPATGCQRR